MTEQDFTNRIDGLINDYEGGESTSKELRDGILDTLIELVSKVSPFEAPVSPTERKILTKQEMFKALESGKKVTHSYFDNNEYLELTTEGYYKFEDGNITTPARFWEFRTETYWETGWKIFGE